MIENIRRPLIVLLFLAGACADGGEAPPAAPGASPDAPLPRYSRELIFVGARDGEPLVASVVARAVDREEVRTRGLRGWLAHGPEWDPYLEESWRTGRWGSPWAVVPHGELRVAAGGPAEVAALWYRRGSRELRMQVESFLTGWNPGPGSRLRLFTGDLTVGGSGTRGVVLELQRVETTGDGAAPGPAADRIVLTGEGVRLLLAVGGGPGASRPAVAWWSSGGETREANGVRLEVAATQPLAEARRPIPRSWRFAVPEAGITGELHALGLAAEVGEEHGGRRAVEIRYTVSGWMERDGERTPMVGLAHHRAE